MSSLAWKNINWPLVDSRIQRYQTRIFKASKENNIYKVRCIQKRLLNSLDAKLVAVRRVTTLNKGKMTEGIDKQIFTNDLQKEKLVRKLRLDGKALPIRRVYIDKPRKVEKRPLGIPTVKDRAKQALCLLALEPEWEAKFETNSYGFNASALQFKEYTFTVDRLPTFRSYRVKLVMTSNSQVYVPRIRDLRVLALA